MRFQLAWFRPATGRSRLFLVNIERRRGRPFLERGDGIGITQEPDVVLWIIRRSEGAACLRPTHDADDIDDATGSTLDTRGRILVIGWHKAAIDQDDAATSKPSWRKHPIPRPFHVGTQRRTGRIHKCFLAIEEFGWESYPTKFFAVLSQSRPAGTRRQIFRSAA